MEGCPLQEAYILKGLIILVIYSLIKKIKFIYIEIKKGENPKYKWFIIRRYWIRRKQRRNWEISNEDLYENLDKDSGLIIL